MLWGAVCLAHNSPVYMLILSKHTLTETSRIMFVQISGYPGLAKLTYKVNHHKHPGLSYFPLQSYHTRVFPEPVSGKLRA